MYLLLQSTKYKIFVSEDGVNHSVLYTSKN